MLWVRVLVKWSHRPQCSLALNFSGYVCIWWPLTLAPGTCLRSLRSVSDASTLHTYKHTWQDWAKQRISQPVSPGYTHQQDDRLCVPRYVYLPPSSYRLAQPSTCAYTHTFSKFSGPLSSHTLNHINTLSSINDLHTRSLSFLPFLLLFLKKTYSYTQHIHTHTHKYTDRRHTQAGLAW